MTGPINWAGRTAHVAVTVNALQEGHGTIADAVVEKTTKARGPGHPHRMMKVTRTPTVAYDIKEWMQGVEEDAPKEKLRNGNAINCRPEWRNTHSQCTGQSFANVIEL